MREKTQAIERKQAKLLSAEQDVKDLSEEFERDRQDYLDTIRNQEKAIKLCEQLLGVVVPCLRRDCNYFNIDKIRSECAYNENSHEWVLPKLVINKTILSPPSLPKEVGRTKVGKPSPSHTSGGNSRQSSCSDVTLTSDDDRYLTYLRKKSDEHVEYFKPKRAMELIGQSQPSKELSPKHSYTSDTPPLAMKSSGSFPNAAAVHGVDPLLDTSFGRRPGKLQSLARNPTVPQPLPEHNILEKVEKNKYFITNSIYFQVKSQNLLASKIWSYIYIMTCSHIANNSISRD